MHADIWWWWWWTNGLAVHCLQLFSCMYYSNACLGIAIFCSPVERAFRHFIGLRADIVEQKWHTWETGSFVNQTCMPLKTNALVSHQKNMCEPLNLCLFWQLQTTLSHGIAKRRVVYSLIAEILCHINAPKVFSRRLQLRLVLKLHCQSTNKSVFTCEHPFVFALIAN